MTQPVLALLRRGDGAGAARLLQRRSGIDPVRRHHLLAIAAHLQGHADDAVAHLSRAIALQADAPSAVTDLASLHNDLGNIWLERGEPERAAAAYEASLAADPVDAPTWSNLATARRRAGDLGGAGDAALQALVLDSGCTPARGVLATVVQQLGADGSDSQARSLVRRWRDLEPDNPVVRHRLAALGEIPAPPKAPEDYVTALFDGAAEEFDSHLARLDYQAPALVVQRVASLLGPPDGSLRVADLGCGTGLLGPGLRPYAATLAGCDLSMAMLQRAQQRGCYDELHQGELVRFLEARTTAYDLLTCADTLCYLGDLSGLATAVAGALRPGGVLTATVEALDDDRDHDRWRLTASGRYAHTERYVREVAGAAGLTGTLVEPVVLRQEAGRPVEGFVVIAGASLALVSHM